MTGILEFISMGEIAIIMLPIIIIITTVAALAFLAKSRLKPASPLYQVQHYQRTYYHPIYPTLITTTPQITFTSHSILRCAPFT